MKIRSACKRLCMSYSYLRKNGEQKIKSDIRRYTDTNKTKKCFWRYMQYSFNVPSVVKDKIELNRQIHNCGYYMNYQTLDYYCGKCKYYNNSTCLLKDLESRKRAINDLRKGIQ